MNAWGHNVQVKICSSHLLWDSVSTGNSNNNNKHLEMAVNCKCACVEGITAKDTVAVSINAKFRDRQRQKERGTEGGWRDRGSKYTLMTEGYVSVLGGLRNKLTCRTAG